MSPSSSSRTFVFRRMGVAALAVACALACARVCESAACWVSIADFNAYKDGHVYSKDDLTNDFDNPRGPYKMVEDGDVGQALTRVEDHALRAEYPEGKILGTDTGFTFYDIADEPADQAWMTYKLYFSRDFDWTLGGKLPGLCGGPVNGDGRTCPTGCSTVDREDGFSVRLMWRKDGVVVAYLYYPDKPVSIRCGEDYVFDTTLESGRWYTISISVSLNTVSDSGPNEDGEIRAWVDGSEVLDVRKMVLRHDEDIKITRTYLTTYVGGSTPEFAPDHDQYALFDDFSSGPGTDVGVCSSSGEVRDQSGGFTAAEPVPAPRRIFDYALISEGPGWSVRGSFANVSTPRAPRLGDAVVFDDARFCYTRCSYTKPCVSFTTGASTCWLHSRDQILANKRNYRDARVMYTKLDTIPGQVQDQSGGSCGYVGGPCCYGAGAGGFADLCVTGDCKPSADAAEITRRGPDALPCLCSSAVCVPNLEYCPPGGVCDQSSDVPPCGALNQDCCAGDACDEEADVGGVVKGLTCSDNRCVVYR